MLFEGICHGLNASPNGDGTGVPQGGAGAAAGMLLGGFIAGGVPCTTEQEQVIHGGIVADDTGHVGILNICHEVADVVRRLHEVSQGVARPDICAEGYKPALLSHGTEDGEL